VWREIGERRAFEGHSSLERKNKERERKRKRKRKRKGEKRRKK